MKRKVGARTRNDGLKAREAALDAADVVVVAPAALPEVGIGPFVVGGIVPD